MDLTLDYANADFIPDGAAYPARWATAAAAFRAAHPPQILPYGPGERQGLDLFRPAGAPEGLMVFVHGGYWRAFDRSLWSHLAAGALTRGWAVAMPSHDLCPAVRIGQITAQIRAAVVCAAGEVAGPLVLTGHSAGGQLVARMACADVALPVIGRVRRVVPISPLANLAPLMATAMNADLRIDAPEAAAESPMLHPRPLVPVTVRVGGAERPVFLDQARWLGRAWNAPVVVEKGRHHFDIVEGLGDAGSDLMEALLG